MKKFFDILLFAVLFIWQLPQNLVALVMMPFMGSLKKIDYRHFCFGFNAEKMLGGISLGSFVYCSPSLSKKEIDVSHEMDGHTVDSKILGPLYLFVIGIPSLLHAYFHKNCPCYYHFYTERLANWHAGIGLRYTSTGYCKLYKKSK